MPKSSMNKYLTLFILLASPLLLSAAGYEVTHLDEQKVFAGTTMLADMSDPRDPKVVEVDFNGNILWQFNPPTYMQGAVLDATLLQTGTILITVHGSGIYEINRKGEIVWSHTDKAASHDADRLANGNTLYNLGWSARGEDVVREVEPSGKLVWSWTGFDEYDRYPFNEVEHEGWMHVNAVTRMDNGNTLVSIRNFNAIAEVAPDGHIVRDWFFRGKDKRTGYKSWGNIKGQRNHEPELLANGNILVALRRPHRFVEFDPDTEEIVWSWSHPDGKHELHTNREANRLPNGNTLGSAGNKLIEIAPDGQIVWQMLAPSGGENHRKFHKAIRIDANGKAYGG